MGFYSENSGAQGLVYQGTWDALLNIPSLTSGIGTQGEYYIVSVAGNTNLNGVTDWQIGDWAVFNGTVWQKIDNSDAITSVGLTMPSAFAVANSPLTSSGTIAVTGAGTAAQYVRGDGQLATFPNASSGGSSVNYYLNGSVAASVLGYQQMSNTAIIGAGTDFPLLGNGLIAEFLTDVANPNRLEIPAGSWNFEMYFSMSSSGGNTKFYVELLKYDGATFTSIASSSAIPEQITGGTAIDLYLTSLAVPQTVLLASDRLAVRVYIVNNSGGRTAILHTENSHLCEIITTFAGGVSAINGLTANTQYFATGSSGVNFNISSLLDTHTFNLPTASAINRGALSSADWTTFNGKVAGAGTTNYVAKFTGASAIGDSLIFDDATNVGIGTTAPLSKLGVLGSVSVGATFGAIAAPTSGAIIEGITSIGASSPVVRLGQKFAISNSTAYGGMAINCWSAGGGCGLLDLNNSNSNTEGNYAVRTNNQLMGALVFRGSDGTAFINGAAIQGVVNGTPSAGIMPTDLQFIISSSTTQNVERMRITNTGNVGIATTVPATKLDVRTNVAYRGVIEATSSFVAGGFYGAFRAMPSDGTVLDKAGLYMGSIGADNAVISSNTTYRNSGFWQSSSTTGSIIQLATGDIYFYTNSSLTANTDYVPTTRLFIKSTGNVGIGTIVPDTKLHVVGTSGTTIKIVDGNQAVGRVLTCDANGVGSWAAAASSGWGILGNAGTVAATNFIGTTDNIGFSFRVNNLKAGRIDVETTGNTYFGIKAGNVDAGLNFNTGIGLQALKSNTTGALNVAIGYLAMSVNTTGAYNTSIGVGALENNSVASRSTSIGYEANRYQGGGDNTAIGYRAAGVGFSGTSIKNTSIGASALTNNEGNENTAVGYQAGSNVSTGINNTLIGSNTGLGITTGNRNTVIGATVTGLASGLSNNIILADGAGVVRLQFNNTGVLSLTGPTVTVVNPTLPNRTIAITVGGTVYYVHAKTSND